MEDLNSRMSQTVVGAKFNLASFAKPADQETTFKQGLNQVVVDKLYLSISQERNYVSLIIVCYSAKNGSKVIYELPYGEFDKQGYLTPFLSGNTKRYISKGYKIAQTIMKACDSNADISQGLLSSGWDTLPNTVKTFQFPWGNQERVVSTIVLPGEICGVYAYLDYQTSNNGSQYLVLKDMFIECEELYATGWELANHEVGKTYNYLTGITKNKVVCSEDTLL